MEEQETNNKGIDWSEIDEIIEEGNKKEMAGEENKEEAPRQRGKMEDTEDKEEKEIEEKENSTGGGNIAKEQAEKVKINETGGKENFENENKERKAVLAKPIKKEKSNNFSQDPETIEKIQELLETANQKGMIEAIKSSRKTGDPFLMDTLRKVLIANNNYKNLNWE